PAHIDAHGYVTLTGEGRYEEALDVVRRVTPFSGVLGRVCVHPCESNCTRRFVEQPISIAGLKRFLADTDRKNGEKKVAVAAEPKTAKVAIVGAGPAGLNCAYSLAKEGYGCTVFEKLPVAGGMLQVGIPDYRLDKKVLDYEIALVEDMGVEIKYNTEVGRSRQGFYSGGSEGARVSGCLSGNRRPFRCQIGNSRGREWSRNFQCCFFTGAESEEVFRRKRSHWQVNPW
ncbi:MAG: Glutamate synthase, partial [Bacillota bacterium]|nr:Glutamate synthase [Bacillota bacterium]